jgi:hypothetical protein
MSIDTSSLKTLSIVLLKKDIFNGKQETRLKPPRMTPHLWKLAYERINPRGTHFVYVS